MCGDGKLELWEQCDTGNPGQLTQCSQLSSQFIGGNLGCSSECLYDTSPCQTGCGDGQIGPYEACDGAARSSDYAGKACKDIPFPFPTWPLWGTVFYSGGALSCESDCDISMAACRAPGFACYVMGVRAGVPLINCFDPSRP